MLKYPSVWPHFRGLNVATLPFTLSLFPIVFCKREEEERKDDDKRRAAEERRRIERERVLKERTDAEERDKRMNEKLQMIEEQR